MLTPQDEFAHQPGVAANWQENYVWHAWSLGGGCGWNLHLGHLKDDGRVDVRAHVVIGGEVTAASYQTPGEDCLGAAGVEVEIDESFRRMRLRLRATGSRGPDAGGWFGREPGEVPFGVDAEIETLPAPLESNAHPELEGMVDLPGTGNHYELGGTWRARLFSGDRTVDAQGLVIRDHSWGGRVWGWEELFWVPMIFPEQRLFVFNVTERFGERWSSLTVSMDDDGVVRKGEDVWVRLGGARRPRQFGTAEVLALGPGFVERSVLHGEIHLPVGRAKSRVGLSDMYSTVRTGDRVGFATVQVFPTEDEVQQGFTEPIERFR